MWARDVERRHADLCHQRRQSIGGLAVHGRREKYQRRKRRAVRRHSLGEEARCCRRSLSCLVKILGRREFLTGGCALMGIQLARASRRRDGGPVIDMHAHWYPQEWLRIAEKEAAADRVRVTSNADGSWQFSYYRFALLAPA